jgi:protein SCO1/2
MTAKMADLQESLRKAQDVLLVSITVDPVRDTPAVLARYADSHGAKSDRWLMLTGEEAAVRELVTAGFKLAAASGDPTHAVLHSTRFAVVDRRGRVRSYRDALEPDSHARVLRDIELLLAKDE